MSFVIDIRYLYFMEKHPEKLLLTAATAVEVGPFLDELRKKSKQSEQIQLDVLITGIGLTATTYHLTRQLQLKKYDLVIQAGVAGSFDLNRKPGSVVVIKQDTIADQSVEELKKLKSLFQLNLVPQNKFPYKKGWLKNPYTELMKLTGLKTVNGISVNQISTSPKMVQFYRDTFNPVTESMEGAALHYVCLMEKVPFFQIRSISNYIGERNKDKWNMKESVNNLNNELIRIIKTLNTQ